MIDLKLYTPTGVSDILPEECRAKKEIENTLWSVFASMGYNELELPTFEYYDVFSGNGGQISQEHMFKFFDENGRILALRPDMTTAVARIVATKNIDEKLPLRYCYTGNVFRVQKTEGARQREFTQSGIELIGVKTAMADAEVITAAIESVLAVGIEEFQMEIGQVAFFNGLVEQAGLDKDDIDKLCARIECKDTLGIKSLTDNLDIPENIKKLMIDLPYLFGGAEIFKKANVDGLNQKSKNALENLKQIYDLLTAYGYEKYISLDLGMLQNIDYYTGTIFKCFTYGVAFPICTGGRYDTLISRFGKNLGAVGVAFGINRLMSALRQTGNNIDSNVPSATLVYAEKGAEADAYEVAYTLRLQSCLVEMYIEDGDHRAADKYAQQTGKDAMIRVLADGKLQMKDYLDEEIVETTVKDFLDVYSDGLSDHDDCDCNHDHHHDGCGCGCEH